MMATYSTRNTQMKKITIASLLLVANAHAMTGALIDEKVPNWQCHANIQFKNDVSREYDLNTKNIMFNATRSGDIWVLKGRAHSTGGKLLMKVNQTNMKGGIVYFTPQGERFGLGTIQCQK